MSNTSLDDFFAKKDKSKKKSKKSKTKIEKNEAQVSGSSGTSGESKKKQKETEKKERLMAVDSIVKDEDDWNEPQDNEPDLSGLRIQHLVIKDEDEGDDNGDDGANGSNTKGENGVWGQGKKDEHIPGDDDEKDAARELQDKVAKTLSAASKKPATVGKYVSPAFRSSRSHHKKEAPNLNSQQDFPTLGAAPATNTSSHHQPQKKQQASSNISSSGPQAYRPPQMRRDVAVDNRYGILER